MIDQIEALINGLTLLATAGQFFNFYLLGEMRRSMRPMSDWHAYLFLTVLGLFMVTEAYVAIRFGLWAYWGYVSLNLWGIYQLMKRKTNK